MLKLYIKLTVYTVFIVWGMCQNVLCNEFEPNEAKLVYRVVSNKEWDFLNKKPFSEHHEMVLQKNTKINLRLCSSGNLLKAISQNLREVTQVQSYVKNYLKYSSKRFLISHSEECVKENGQMSLIEIWVSPQDSGLPNSDEIIEDCQLDSVYKEERFFRNIKDFTNKLSAITLEIKNNPKILGIIRSYSLNDKEVKRIQRFFLHNGLSPDQYLIQNLQRKIHLKDRRILLILANLGPTCVSSV